MPDDYKEQGYRPMSGLASPSAVEGDAVGNLSSAEERSVMVQSPSLAPSLDKLKELWSRMKVDNLDSSVVKDKHRMHEKFKNKERTKWFNQAKSDKNDVEQTCIPQDTGEIVSNIVAGAICGVKISIGMAVFASLQWSQCPKLAKHVSIGVKMNYFTAAVLLAIYAKKGTIPFGMVLCQDIPCLLLGKMATGLCHMVPEEVLVHHFLILTAVTTISSGLVFYLAGSLNWTSLAQSVPTSVVGGFVASCGIGLWRAALEKITNVQWADHGIWPLQKEWHKLLAPHRYWLTITGLAMALALKEGPAAIRSCVQNRALKSLATPFINFAPIGLFYIVLHCMNYPPEVARKAEWLPPSMPVRTQTKYFYTFWSPWLEIFSNPQMIDWYVFLKFLPQILAVAVLSTLELVFNVAGIDSVMVDSMVDLRKEAEAMGIANMICGLLGGNVGYLQGGMTLAAKQIDSATHKLSIYTAAALSAFLFLSGLPVASIIPKFVSGAFFLVTGFFFVKKWVWDSYFCMPFRDWRKVILIVLCSIIWDIQVAILVGIMCNLMSFNYHSLLVSRIKSIERGDERHSDYTSHVRPFEEAKFLFDKGYQIMIIRCCGFLYWGDATQIVHTIMDAVVDSEVVVKYLIIDFQFVLNIDISAVKAFDKCIRAAKKEQIRMCFSGADEHMMKVMQYAEFAPTMKGVGLKGECDLECTPHEFEVKCYSRLEDALKEYEDDLINNLFDRDQAVSNTRDYHAIDMKSGAFTFSAELCEKFADLAVKRRNMTFYAEESNDGTAAGTGIEFYAAGEVITRIGDKPGILLVIEGAVSQQSYASNKEPLMFETHSVLGAVDYALQRPATSVIAAVENTHVLHIGDRAIHTMRDADLETYVKFQDFMMSILRSEAKDQNHR